MAQDPVSLLFSFSISEQGKEGPGRKTGEGQAEKPVRRMRKRPEAAKVNKE